ncbi:MAG: hypothetical protein IJW67_07475 [Blautia sp.]|nr:hypothetical protein [Blautia sp.]
MDDKKWRYPRKRKYLKDFKPDEDGSYSYQGAVMHCTLTGEEYKKTLRSMLLIAILAMALVLAAGCLPHTGMEGCFYLLLPYAGTLVLLIRLVWNLGQLLYHGSEIREYIYKNTGERLPAQLLFGTILPLIGLAGVVYARARGTYQGSGAGAVLFVISLLAAAAGTQAIRLLGRQLAWISQ